jgi:hypothetical protein
VHHTSNSSPAPILPRSTFVLQDAHILQRSIAQFNRACLKRLSGDATTAWVWHAKQAGGCWDVIYRTTAEPPWGRVLVDAAWPRGPHEACGWLFDEHVRHITGFHCIVYKEGWGQLDPFILGLASTASPLLCRALTSVIVPVKDAQCASHAWE